MDSAKHSSWWLQWVPSFWGNGSMDCHSLSWPRSRIWFSPAPLASVSSEPSSSYLFGDVCSCDCKNALHFILCSFHAAQSLPPPCSPAPLSLSTIRESAIILLSYCPRVRRHWGLFPWLSLYLLDSLLNSPFPKAGRDLCTTYSCYRWSTWGSDNCIDLIHCQMVS